MRTWLRVMVAVAVCGVLGACSGSPRPGQLVRVKAPKGVVDVSNGWEGKYVLYAHKNADIHALADLKDRSIFIADINTQREPWVHYSIFRDFNKLQLASGLLLRKWIQDNPETYRKTILTDETAVGFMSAGVAAQCRFADEPDLVRLMLVE